jgi:hypothetical protein
MKRLQGIEVIKSVHYGIWNVKPQLFTLRFDRGNCKCKGLIDSKAKEGRQDRKKPAVPRTNLIRLG